MLIVIFLTILAGFYFTFDALIKIYDGLQKLYKILEEK